MLMAHFGTEFAQLVADMCKNRGLDQLSRSQLCDLFPFDAVLAVIAGNRALSLRASYCELMHALHVDCFPHTSIDVTDPQRTHLGGAVYPAPTASDASLHRVMAEVQRVLFRSLEFRCGSSASYCSGSNAVESLELHSKRVMVLSLVRLFDRLIRFGYLPSRRSVVKYFDLLERELLHLVDLDSALSKHLADATPSVAVDSIDTFGVAEAIMFEPQGQWAQLMLAVFECLHTLCKHNENALLTDALRFFAMNWSMIERERLPARQQHLSLQREEDGIMSPVSRRRANRSRSWVEMLHEYMVSRMLLSRPQRHEERLRLLVQLGHHKHADIVSASHRMLTVVLATHSRCPVCGSDARPSACVPEHTARVTKAG